MLVTEAHLNESSIDRVEVARHLVVHLHRIVHLVVRHRTLKETHGFIRLSEPAKANYVQEKRIPMTCRNGRQHVRHASVPCLPSGAVRSTSFAARTAADTAGERTSGSKLLD